MMLATLETRDVDRINARSSILNDKDVHRYFYIQLFEFNNVGNS